MATRFVAVSLAKPRRRRGRFGAAALLAVAAALELWLIVIGVAAGVILLARLRRRLRTRLLPALLAGRALAAGREPASVVEEWMTIWLAVLAGGRVAHLRRAMELVGPAWEQDPWRVQVACARLEVAVGALASGQVTGLGPTRRGSHPAVRVLAWGGVLAVLLAASADDVVWWLLPLAVACVGFGAALHDVQEWRALPELLATEAGQLELTDSEVTGAAPVLDLVMLSGGDRRALHHARRLIEDRHHPTPADHVAVRRLREAETTVHASAGRSILVSDGGLHWWMAPRSRPIPRRNP